MIKLHRSVLSATLPPLEGFDVGHHAVVSSCPGSLEHEAIVATSIHVVRRRPGLRPVFIMDGPSHWTSFCGRLHYSSPWLSELVSLRCSSFFMIVDASKVHFFSFATPKNELSLIWDRRFVSSSVDGRLQHLSGHRWVMHRSGIVAPPGSTRSTSHFGCFRLGRMFSVGSSRRRLVSRGYV